MLLGRNARAERAVYDEIRLRQGGLEEQGVGDDADIRAHAAKLDAEALSVRRALFLGQRADVFAQRRRAEGRFRKGDHALRTFFGDIRFERPAGRIADAVRHGQKAPLAGIHVVFFMGIEGEDDLPEPDIIIICRGFVHDDDEDKDDTDEKAEGSASDAEKSAAEDKEPAKTEVTEDTPTDKEETKAPSDTKKEQDAE